LRQPPPEERGGEDHRNKIETENNKERVRSSGQGWTGKQEQERKIKEKEPKKRDNEIKKRTLGRKE